MYARCSTPYKCVYCAFVCICVCALLLDSRYRTNWFLQFWLASSLEFSIDIFTSTDDVYYTRILIYWLRIQAALTKWSRPTIFLSNAWTSNIHAAPTLLTYIGIGGSNRMPCRSLHLKELNVRWNEMHLIANQPARMNVQKQMKCWKILIKSLAFAYTLHASQA